MTGAATKAAPVGFFTAMPAHEISRIARLRFSSQHPDSPTNLWFLRPLQRSTRYPEKSSLSHLLFCRHRSTHTRLYNCETSRHTRSPFHRNLPHTYCPGVVLPHSSHTFLAVVVYAFIGHIFRYCPLRRSGARRWDSTLRRDRAHNCRCRRIIGRCIFCAAARQHCDHSHRGNYAADLFFHSSLRIPFFL